MKCISNSCKELYKNTDSNEVSKCFEEKECLTQYSYSSWPWEEIRGRASGKKHIPIVSVLSNAVLSQNDGCKQDKIIRDEREIHKIGVKKAAPIISQSCSENNVKFQREKLFGEVRILYMSGVFISHFSLRALVLHLEDVMKRVHTCHHKPLLQSPLTACFCSALLM